jgi:hypothetical protein
MKSLAKKLCDRNLELKNNFLVADLTNKTSPIYEAAINLSKKGMDASKKEEYY